MKLKKQTVLATPNPLPAEQAESVSSDKRGHQQLGGRTTWWSLAKLAANLLLVLHTAAKADFVALNCLRTVPTVQIRHPQGPNRCVRSGAVAATSEKGMSSQIFVDCQTPSFAAAQRQVGEMLQSRPLSSPTANSAKEVG